MIYDIIELDNNGAFQIVCGGESYKIEFEQDYERSMFEEFIDCKNSKYSTLIKKFLKKYDKQQVYLFFNQLKESGLFYFETEEELFKGRFYEFIEDVSHKQKLEQTTLVGLIGKKESNIVKFLKDSDFNNFVYLDMNKLEKENDVESIIKRSDFLVYDASLYNPTSIMDFNKLAIKYKTPWLLIQGVRNGKGYLGPLFFGKDTGCYNCFLKRIKSNLVYDQEYVGYESWLVKNKLFSKKGRHDKSYDRIVASLAILEIKKFVLDFGFPHTYGNLIEVDFDKYQTQLHTLYKVPFCEICYEDVEFSRAPWLSPATLENL